MTPDIQFTDLPDEAMVLIYKSKAPHQRLEIAFSLWTFARSLVKCGVRMNHPDWSEREIEEATSRRMLEASARSEKGLE